MVGGVSIWSGRTIGQEHAPIARDISTLLTATNGIERNLKEEGLSSQKVKKIKIPQNYKFGVVETTNQWRRSFISFYDEDFNRLSTSRMPYAGLNSDADPVQYINNVIYLNPVDQGPISINGKANSKVVMIDDSGKVKEIETKLEENKYALKKVGKDFFILNNSNMESSISKVSLENDTAQVQSLGKWFAINITAYKDEILVFMSEFPENPGGPSTYRSKVTFYDRDLVEKRSIDLSAVGYDYRRIIVDEANEKIYFSVYSDPEAGKSQGLYVLNMKNDELKELVQNKILFDFDKRDNILYMLEGDLSQGRGKEKYHLLTLNLDTMVTKTRPLSEGATFVRVDGDDLYVMYEKTMDHFKITEDEVALIKTAPIQTRDKDWMTQHFYVTSFFIKPEEGGDVVQ